VAVCEDKTLLKTAIGKIFKLGDTCGDFKMATFKTKDVQTGKDVEAKCVGYVENGVFKHDTDTFEGQCGTPYTVKGYVQCVHIETDGVSNIGTSCTVDVIQEILNH
jgi:V8-like Glu-specific endopeptidase